MILMALITMSLELSASSCSQRARSFLSMPTGFTIDGSMHLWPDYYYRPQGGESDLLLKKIEHHRYTFEGQNGEASYLYRKIYGQHTFSIIEPQDEYKLVGSRELNQQGDRWIGLEARLLSRLSRFISDLADSRQSLSLYDLDKMHQAVIDSNIYEEAITGGMVRGSEPRTVVYHKKAYLVDNSNHEVGEAPAPQQVKQLLDAWLREVNRRELKSSLEVLSKVREFILMHPYSNANERVAILLNRYLHAINGLPLVLLGDKNIFL